MVPDPRDLLTAMAAFQTPRLSRSVWQFGITFGAYLAINALMYALVPISPWLAVGLALPAGGLVVRLFIVQHDCGHGAFFRSRRLNDWLGRFCSAFTFTPYAFWRRQHATHHACFNNLDRRDPGIDLYSSCATLKEYQAMPARKRLIYRLIRHPVLTQLVLPPFVFLLAYRVPFDAPANWLRERRSVLITNLVLACVMGALCLALGWRSVLLVQLPTISIASIVGVWLFSVQHRFEDTSWQRQSEWNHIHASLEGSSYLRLPRLLQWFTGNIGYHHVHHLSSRIPNYRLQECHEARPELRAVAPLGFWQAIRATGYALWDEDRGCMIPFPRAGHAALS